MEEQNEQPLWRPLDAYQRRVVGVLIEKSKTTPGSYPMTLNSITTGCNQKSNRAPQMEIASDDVELILDQLREMKAVVEIHGDGRVTKYKHAMYPWLGVSKTEIAVMGELLLRGEQTVGELRSRAARMEPIAGMTELRPILDALLQKNLIVELTPAGRGQVVTHHLYSEKELAEIRQQVGSGAPVPTTSAPSTPQAPLASSPLASSPSPPPRSDDSHVQVASKQGISQSEVDDRIESLESRVEDLERQVESLKEKLEQLLS